MTKLYAKHNKTIGKVLLLMLSIIFTLETRGNVVGFDFGQTFFKITLVKPGQPFAIVENTSSGRKTHSSVTLTNDIRLFGPDSFMESSKYPASTFN